MVMRDTMAMIRDAIGEDSYLLGSIAPFMPCIGYVDGMRIASDMGAQWTEGAFGPANLLQELPYDNYFNRQNDPDSVILRHSHMCCKIPENHRIRVILPEQIIEIIIIRKFLKQIGRSESAPCPLCTHI